MPTAGRVVIIAAGCLALMLAQAKLVRGVVVASDGQPLARARVAGAGAAAPAVFTGADGRFEIPAPATGQLVVSAPGYGTQSATATAGAMRVVLAPAPLAEAVTVTASGLDQNVAAVPIHTTIMGWGRLQSSAAVNADSVLREFSDLGTFRVNSALTANPTTQGVALLGTGSSGASRALVLLDGLPLNDIYGGWVNWLRVPDEDLETVTVVAGGASPLYGNDALSGVIGLATRPALATRASLRSGGGGLGMAFSDGVGSLVAGRWAATLRGRVVHVAGFVPVQTPGLIDTKAGVTAADFAPTIQFTRSGREQYHLSSEYFTENRRNGTQLQTNATRLRQLAGGALVDHAGLWELSGFDQTEDFGANFSAIAADRNSEALTLEQHVPSRAEGAGVNWTLARPRWTLRAGASATHVSAVDNETAPPNLTSAARTENGRQRLAGAFAEWLWTPARAWSLTAMLRDDHWWNYDAFQYTPALLTPFPARSSTAASPALGAVWAARPWLALRASAYESFRAPTLNELYRPFRAGNVLTDANPLLAAERYRGAQAGATVTALPRTRLGVTYFDGYVTDLVTSVTLATTPTLITRQRQNLGRVRPRGATLDGQWSPHSGFTLWSSYTHLDATVLTAPQSKLIGTRLAHVPDNEYSARGLWAWRGWTASGIERFGGSNFDDDQNTLPLPAFWNTDLYGARNFGRIAPYIAVENLWNRRYAVELTPEADRNAPRAVTAGVHLVFGGN